MSFAEEKGKGEKNARLIEAYQGGDKSALDALVSDNIGLVKNIARRFYGRGTEYEDIINFVLLIVFFIALSICFHNKLSISTQLS